MLHSFIDQYLELEERNTHAPVLKKPFKELILAQNEETCYSDPNLFSFCGRFCV